MEYNFRVIDFLPPSIFLASPILLPGCALSLCPRESLAIWIQQQLWESLRQQL